MAKEADEQDASAETAVSGVDAHFSTTTTRRSSTNVIIFMNN
jgi:hypothetical protein